MVNGSGGRADTKVVRFVDARLVRRLDVEGSFRWNADGVGGPDEFEKESIPGAFR